MWNLRREQDPELWIPPKQFAIDSDSPSPVTARFPEGHFPFENLEGLRPANPVYAAQLRESDLSIAVGGSATHVGCRVAQVASGIEPNKHSEPCGVAVIPPLVTRESTCRLATDGTPMARSLQRVTPNLSPTRAAAQEPIGAQSPKRFRNKRRG